MLKKIDMKDKILKLFLYNKKLKFNEIHKQVNERSNKLAYHLKNLIKKGILEKQKDDYKLSQSSEHLIPFITVTW